MLHFIGENFWLTIAYLARMQFPKDTGFDTVKLSVMALRRNMVVT